MKWFVYPFLIIAILVSSCSSKRKVTNDEHWTSVLGEIGIIRVYHNQNLVSSEILSDLIEVKDERIRKQESERYNERKRKSTDELDDSTDRAIYDGMKYADEYLRARGQKSYIMPISPSGKRYYQKW